MLEQPPVIFHGSVIHWKNVTTSEVASESRSTQRDIDQLIMIWGFFVFVFHTLRNFIVFP